MWQVLVVTQFEIVYCLTLTLKILILFAMNPEQVFIVLFVSSGLYKS